MNRFKGSFDAAQQKLRRLIAWLAGGAAVLAAVVGGFLLLGGVAVQVLPPEAAPGAQVRIVRGWALMFNDQIYTLPGTIVLHVASEGFYPEEVELAGDRETKGFVGVTLREKPGQLRAESRPSISDAVWSLNGKFQRSGESLDIKLKAGVYQLSVNSPRHRETQVEVEILRGQESELVVDLEALLGQLNVTTEPPGATISLNGLTQGLTPSNLEVDIGAHEVEVALPGYQSVSETVQVTKANSKIQRNYVLLPADAFVTFRLRPGGGRLLLDGRIQEDLDKIPVRARVTHHAAYRKRGYRETEKEFQLQPGESTVLELSLQKIVGEVEVVSKPAADVLVDGKPAGTTTSPLRLKLSAIEHEIVVARKGYETVTRKVTPVPGQLSRIDLELVTEKEARLRDASESVVNSVGMTMRLFVGPDKFSMGTPRGEKGRQANEFLRSVRLTRPFYAGVHEVTDKQLKAFRGAAPPSSSGDLPAVNVAWIEAVQFCNWLSKREGLDIFYRLDRDNFLGVNGDADGYRLPTEAEWEWLARKAGRSATVRFPWGDDEQVPSQAGNFADESAKGKVSTYIPNYTDRFSGLAPVGQFKPNRVGIYDLAGNVHEWMHDSYSPIAPVGSGEEVNPRRDEPALTHVIRGSSWRSATLAELRAAYRNKSIEPSDDLGFRVVRYLYGDEDAVNR